MKIKKNKLTGFLLQNEMKWRIPIQYLCIKYHTVGRKPLAQLNWLANLLAWLSQKAAKIQEVKSKN